MDIKVFERLKRKISLMLSRAVVKIVNDSFKRQQLQVTMLAGEVADNVERFQNYGVTSVPPQNSEAIVLSIGGKRQHLVAIAVEDKETRLKDLTVGDSALYHMDGHYILLTKNGDKTKVMLVCDELEVIANKALFDVQQTQFTGSVDILGDITVKGSAAVRKDLTVTGESKATDHVSSGVSGQSHTHTVTSIFAPTAPPLPTKPV